MKVQFYRFLAFTSSIGTPRRNTNVVFVKQYTDKTVRSKIKCNIRLIFIDFQLVPKNSRIKKPSFIFSCESSSRYANVCQSVSLSVINSVCLSVTPIFLSDLLVYFIIANRTDLKLKQSLSITRHK